ncbi:ribonuclease HII [Candidatus Wolfebacteria bacterium]|uniref:Ribonuclease HII n=1 Tax=Candidatus Wolfebacteria bacterium CG_4_10_14_0_2_um_filter_39_18 TaxID=1975061 RepID=A0A2M7TG95_9BACT|nr:ribonuclease HII [Candidatus Wolfebacteria bacterium]PIZ45004.1 MAG: ribonuclease HII [Candidatus Wolfebacteria bacterium CG_4_10_14_0_2_um_filter_39_18]
MTLKKSKYIIGIDEVGRGALAGNVTVAAVLLPRKSQIPNPKLQTNSKFKILNSKLKLRDSKKLTPKQREIWFEYLKNELRLPYAVASVSPKIIDKINISKAANLAAGKAFSLLIKNSGLRIKNCEVFLDGGLYIQNLKFKIIIRGDEKIPAISLASIIAKVSRDRQMINLHKKYPKYGFEKHKGYGTKKHFKAIRKHGPSKIHRLTFLKKMR